MIRATRVLEGWFGWCAGFSLRVGAALYVGAMGAELAGVTCRRRMLGKMRGEVCGVGSCVFPVSGCGDSDSDPFPPKAAAEAIEEGKEKERAPLERRGGSSLRALPAAPQEDTRHRGPTEDPPRSCSLHVGLEASRILTLLSHTPWQQAALSWFSSTLV